jgi:hypothetical protein
MEDKIILDIAIAPIGETYRRLLHLSLDFCDQALLVVRDSINLNQHGKDILKSLESFMLQKVSKATQWPGTVLHRSDLFPENTATLFYFRFNSESATVLKNSVEGL